MLTFFFLLCVCGGGLSLMLGIILHHFPPFSLRQGFSIKPRTHQYGYSPRPIFSGIPLPLHSKAGASHVSPGISVLFEVQNPVFTGTGQVLQTLSRLSCTTAALLSHRAQDDLHLKGEVDFLILLPPDSEGWDYRAVPQSYFIGFWVSNPRHHAC